ncbi:hypothetical protein L596_030877 [Steinernema carpocapsae]|uniref:Uncharacterized protein n=1 Tax=Steinernema carpocapsae TaxID=34508 RepID=A0A4U5LNE6_STECR|nr:hypothetical protein L596_030877 [Steinernema carpocapsae]
MTFPNLVTHQKRFCRLRLATRKGQFRMLACYCTQSGGWTCAPLLPPLLPFVIDDYIAKRNPNFGRESRGVEQFIVRIKWND